VQAEIDRNPVLRANPPRPPRPFDRRRFLEQHDLLEDFQYTDPHDLTPKSPGGRRDSGARPEVMGGNERMVEQVPR